MTTSVANESTNISQEKRLTMSVSDAFKSHNLYTGDTTPKLFQPFNGKRRWKEARDYAWCLIKNDFYQYFPILFLDGYIHSKRWYYTRHRTRSKRRAESQAYQKGEIKLSSIIALKEWHLVVSLKIRESWLLWRLLKWKHFKISKWIADDNVQWKWKRLQRNHISWKASDRVRSDRFCRESVSTSKTFEEKGTSIQFKAKYLSEELQSRGKNRLKFAFCHFFDKWILLETLKFS